MVARKPLVLNAGQMEQLQAGDTLDVNLVQIITRNFTSTALAGQAVYSNAGATVDLAQANAQGTIRVAGLATAGVTAANPGDVAVDGVLTLTTGEWDAIAGTTGGLTPGANYFLDPTTAGNLTAIAPTTTGQFVVRVGHALSTTELEIEVQQPIKL